jgi:hypothetical protein
VYPKGDLGVPARLINTDEFPLSGANRSYGRTLTRPPVPGKVHQKDQQHKDQDGVFRSFQAAATNPVFNRIDR